MELIAEKVLTLPNAPGVYRMIDRDGEVIYVGKARDLKKRVSSYAKGQGHTTRIARMIMATADMAFVQTASETEALLLEANLIKRYRPRYNVLMRDDKSFPNILLTGGHPFPQIVKHRGARTRKGIYFGPFASAGAVGRTLNTLQRAFLLRSCTDSVFESRTRPCLLYQIKRCSAPCVGRIDEPGYKALMDDAEAFLNGRSRAVTEALGKRMEEAAAALDFESAARLRDRIRSLAHVQQTQGINPQTIDDADVFAIAAAHGETCIQVFFFRSGQNWGNRAYFPRHDRGATTAEVLDAFLAQFYDGREAPKQIIISEDIPERALLAEALSVRQERKIEVLLPQRGEKREIAVAATMNARDALMRRQAESAAETELLQGVAEVFGLDGPPQRIEVYDNSHIQGSKPVGGMIVAGPRGFEKSQYRKFNIKSAAGNDDFAMMREMLTRRFARLTDVKQTADDAHAPIFDEKETDEIAERPDLILIDGGLGQLSSALEAMRAAGVEGITIAGISKGPDRDAGRENFHLPGKPSFMLEPNHPVLFYLQRLRDEAHRFAIGTHRARRSKAISDNPLDAIDGIGAKRKRALLLHFGSAKAIRNASAADLASVEGVSEALARRIYDHFRA
jgi:excinuclease ABC subunit C